MLSTVSSDSVFLSNNILFMSFMHRLCHLLFMALPTSSDCSLCRPQLPTVVVVLRRYSHPSAGDTSELHWLPVQSSTFQWNGQHICNSTHIIDLTIFYGQYISLSNLGFTLNLVNKSVVTLYLKHGTFYP